MTLAKPRVSVVMNCYNGEEFLREAINSVYEQEYTDWEIVFWDNVSTDSSAEIASSYDSKLKYYRASELSTLGAARSFAISKCLGKWIAFLDVDDIWYKTKLSSQMKMLEGGDFVLAYAGIEEINREGKHIRSRSPKKAAGMLLERLLLQFDVNMVTPILNRKTLIENNLNFNPNITASEEYNLFLRIAAKGPVLVQNEILGKYRVYTDSLTDKNISKWGEERRQTLAQLEKENPGIQQSYAAGFKEAFSRAAYYDACYYASIGDFKSTRASLKAIGSEKLVYKLLYLASQFPWLWNWLQKSKRHGAIGNIAKVLLAK